MELAFPTISCGSYSIELTPSKSWLSVSKSGAFGPDGVTTFYDTITIDQTLLNHSDTGTATFTMRVYQDPSVDGYTQPVADQIQGEVTYTFDITIHKCAYKTEHTQAAFVPTPNPVIIDGLSDSETLSFPHFEKSPWAESRCNTITQTLTGLSIGTVTWNPTTDNTISLPTLTSADVGSYSLTY
jgi:hypothetical protein